MKTKWNAVFFAVVFGGILSVSAGFAADEIKPDKKEGAPQKMEFENGYIEAVNKSSRDFGSKATSDRKREKPHLYERFFLFMTERGETLREVRYSSQ